MLIGGPLLALLIFATSTEFVRAAWAVQSFQIGVYLLLAIYLIASFGKGSEDLAGSWTAGLVYLIPLWGVLQLITHTAASSIETREAALRWGALAGVFFLAQVIGRTRASRHVALHAFLYWAVAMALLCLMQLFTSHGRVLWLFPSEYPSVYATFSYRNNYVQFIEIILPIALWWVLRGGWRSWGYALAAGVLYASVIGSSSRAGAALCTAEMLAMLGIALFQSLQHTPGRSLRSTTAMFALVPILAATFTIAAGWRTVWTRFQQPDPFGARREFLIAAIDMAEHRPLIGYGLGSFPEVYQQHATVGLDIYANHAHNDWAEFAADGGIPLFLLVLIPFAAAIPTAVRHPWGMGLIAVLLNACVDYPFPRPAVSGWMFALLGLLYAQWTADRQAPKSSPTPAVPEDAHRPIEFRR